MSYPGPTALFLFGVADDAELASELARIPERALIGLDAVVVVEDRPGGPLTGADPISHEGRKLEVLIHRAARPLDFGGMRKAAFEFAALRRFGTVVFARAGVHPLEALPRLLDAVAQGPEASVWLARSAQGAPAASVRQLARRAATGLLNRVLGLRLADVHTSYRAYPMRAIARIPHQLDSDDRRFDTQLAIQCRALGLPIREVSVRPDWREFSSDRERLGALWESLSQALDYRFHQLHGNRRHRYLVDHGVHYTLKQSSTGSHMQIVDRIQPGSRVLDLGCSQGLLARPLAERGVSVTGVDTRPGDDASDALDAYYRRDLERPLELPTGRVFDFVVSSDVIEHLREREQLLRSARRYLKPGGRLLISTPNIAIWFYRLSLLVGRFEYGPRGVLDETHVHLFTRATFRREVEAAGFHIVGEMATALPFEVVFESTGRSRLVGSLARSYHALARFWPEMFAYQFILEAEITTLDDDATRAAEPTPSPEA